MDKGWIDKIDRENPSWADIARLLDVSSIMNDSEREEKAHYEWIAGLIKTRGPRWVHKNRDRLKNEYTGTLRPRWMERWSREDREQRRKAGRKGGEGSKPEGEPSKPKKKKRPLTYESSSPRSHGLLSRAFRRKNKKSKY